MGCPQHRMLRVKEEAGGSRSTCPERSPMGNTQGRLILSQLLQIVESSAVAVTVLPLGVGMGRNEPVVPTSCPVSRCERL